jgi:hypothetical protein
MSGRRFGALTACSVGFLFVMSYANAGVTTVDIKSMYGTSRAGIERAIGEAKSHFHQNPDDTVIFELPAGTVDLSQDSQGRATIDVSEVRPGPQGRLIFKGAGKDKTTLVFGQNISIYGRDVYRVSFVGFHMTRKQYTVSQGHVVSVEPGAVVLDIQDGFPSPADIFDPLLHQGRYLRRYTDSTTHPTIIETNNVQIAWSSAQQIAGRRWRINLTHEDQIASYPVGSLIGIKSKHGGDACWFLGGSDIVFDDVMWTQKTRCTFRGISDVKILNSVATRSPPINNQTPCLASAEGGPQILGDLAKPPVTGTVVDHFYADATGDDSIAFLNATGVIRNSHLADSFARCILLYDSPTVELQNNELARCPLLYKH